MRIFIIGCDVCLAVEEPVEKHWPDQQKTGGIVPKGWQRIAFSTIAGPTDGYGGQSVDVCPNCLRTRPMTDLLTAALEALGKDRPGWYLSALEASGYDTTEVRMRLRVEPAATP